VTAQLSGLVRRIAFWLPLTVCTWMALMPQPPTGAWGISDAVQHVGAFVYLTFAAGLAFPGRSTLVVALAMLGYGALLEVLQGLGGVRMAEWRDLGMDAVGIAGGSACYALLKGLRRARGEPTRQP